MREADAIPATQPRGDTTQPGFGRRRIFTAVRPQLDARSVLMAKPEERTDQPNGKHGEPVATTSKSANGKSLPPGGQEFLNFLLRLQLISPSQTQRFVEETEHLSDLSDADKLGAALVRAELMTGYQLERVLAGATHGLVLGNYRVLERLGAGGMGVVYLAEHVFMKRRVALKVLPVDDDCPATVLERFYSEMRLLAELHHPNIVMAYDAGKAPPAGPGMPSLLYLVMELVDGGDLEAQVLTHGTAPINKACAWIRQAACGLQYAHDHQLIHRDVKPSNLFITDQGLVKVGDFGLARQFCSRLTDPRQFLGTLEYVAPEQSLNPATVGHQADIYGLGATLFWMLAGQPPHPPANTVTEALYTLQHKRPRRLREFRPDAPRELEALVDCMLDPEPARRPPRAVNVMNILLPFAH